LIVAREHEHLLPLARAQYAGDESLEVILDRRRPARPGVPATERRRPPDYWEDLRYHPMVITLRRHREEPVEPVAQSTQEEAQMETHPAQNAPLGEWLDEGRRLVAAWLEESHREHERLRLRAEVAERECEKLRDEIRSLLQDNEGLRSQTEQLRRAQGDVATAFSRALEPLNALAQRLGQGRRAP
jgi:hypothetical protein